MNFGQFDNKYLKVHLMVAVVSLTSLSNTPDEFSETR